MNTSCGPGTGGDARNTAINKQVPVLRELTFYQGQPGNKQTNRSNGSDGEMGKTKQDQENGVLAGQGALVHIDSSAKAPPMRSENRSEETRCLAVREERRGSHSRWTNGKCKGPKERA